MILNIQKAEFSKVPTKTWESIMVIGKWNQFLGDQTDLGDQKGLGAPVQLKFVVFIPGIFSEVGWWFQNSLLNFGWKNTAGCMQWLGGCSCGRANVDYLWGYVCIRISRNHFYHAVWQGGRLGMFQKELGVPCLSHPSDLYNDFHLNTVIENSTSATPQQGSYHNYQPAYYNKFHLQRAMVNVI